MAQVLLDQTDDCGPAAVMGLESPLAARDWNAIEARFGDGEQRAVCLLFGRELDEGHGFGGIIDAPFDGMWMPAKGEQSFGFDAINHTRETQACVLLLRLVRSHRRPRYRRAHQTTAALLTSSIPRCFLFYSFSG